MIDFAIPAHAGPLAQLASTITSIRAVVPEARVMVGFHSGNDDLAIVVQDIDPHAEVVIAGGEGGAETRSALVGAAQERFVYMLSPGARLRSDVDLTAAVDEIRDRDLAMLFTGTVSAGPDAPPRPDLVVAFTGEADGHARFEQLAVPESRSAITLGSHYADTDCIVDADAIGPGRSTDWDPQFTDGLEMRDLATSLEASTPGRVAFRSHMTERLPGPRRHDPVPLDPSATLQMQARFIRKWGFHTEQLDKAVCRHAFGGDYRGFGRKVDVTAYLRPIVQAHWKQPSVLTPKLAEALATTGFNRFVITKNADMLVNNMVIAPDGSWLCVTAAGCAEDQILGWLAGQVGGIGQRRTQPVGDFGSINGLVRPVEIGLAATVSLLESSRTFKFAFVADPATRAMTVYRRAFDAGPTRPAAEALRSIDLRRRAPAGGDSMPSATEPYSLVEFLEAVAEQDEYQRHREWRTMTGALAADRVSYDLVGRCETLQEDLAHVAAQLGYEPPVLPPWPTGDTHVVSAAAAAALGAAYSADFERFGYANPATARRSQ
jgi:hypothetical protein